MRRPRPVNGDRDEIVRPGGAIGRVGVPQHEAMPGAQTSFYKNVTIGGGPAPARAYIDELLPDILEGRIEPGPRLRPHRRSRRSARRLPRDERPRVDQSAGEALMDAPTIPTEEAE